MNKKNKWQDAISKITGNQIELILRIIKDFEKEYLEVQHEINCWISVKERLPKKFERVLVFRGNYEGEKENSTHVGFLNHKKEFMGSQGGLLDDDLSPHTLVTHWRPLPDITPSLLMPFSSLPSFSYSSETKILDEDGEISKQFDKEVVYEDMNKSPFLHDFIKAAGEAPRNPPCSLTPFAEIEKTIEKLKDLKGGGTITMQKLPEKEYQKHMESNDEQPERIYRTKSIEDYPEKPWTIEYREGISCSIYSLKFKNDEHALISDKSFENMKIHEFLDIICMLLNNAHELALKQENEEEGCNENEISEN